MTGEFPKAIGNWYLREIPSRLRVEAKLVEPNLIVHDFFQCLLREFWRDRDTCRQAASAKRQSI